MQRAGILLLVASLLLTGCFSNHRAFDAPSDDPLAPQPPAPSKSFSWSTENLTGDVAIQVAFTLAEPSACHLEAGLANAGRAGEVASVATLQFGPETDRRYEWVFVDAEHVAHAHATAAVDSRSLVGSSGFWSSRFVFDDQYSGRLTFTLAGMNLVGWDAPLTNGTTMFVQIDCGTELENVTLQAGREALVFSHKRMAEGAGVHADALQEPTASLALENRATARFETSNEVVLFAGYEAPGAGHVVIESPRQGAEWIFGPFQNGFEAMAAEPDLYSFTLDYAGAGSNHRFWGGMVGLNPVLALEEIEAMPKSP